MNFSPLLNFFKKLAANAWKKFRAMSPLKAIFFVFQLVILIILIFFVSVLGFFVYYAKDLPRPEKFTERPFVESTKIYDRTGKVVLYELYGEEKRQTVPLSEIPANLKNAVIAVEDAKFYQHHGIDIMGIFRSINKDIKLRTLSYGGSTISQQLIRATFLTTQKTAQRKIREIILTLELERRYNKDQILEWYLNQIPFGPNLYGVEVASQAYFSKSAKDLSLGESAILAAMIQSPSYYYFYKEDLKERYDYVLDRMAAENYIAQTDADAAKGDEPQFNQAITGIKAPHFVFYVQSYLEETYGKDYLQRGGLKVYTTLDWDYQQIAEKSVAEGVKNNAKIRAHNAALVALDPKMGEILAMVGSADWFGEPYPEGCDPGVNCLFDPKVNVATSRPGRQPGSSFKPFVYATAFSKGYSDQYVVIDEPTNFGIWGGKPYEPRNYDGLFRGPVTLRQALAQSLNIPSVKVLAYLAGQEDSINTARKFGITTLDKPASNYGLAIVLGGGEVRLLDMVSAYGVFAADGMKTTPTAILKIEDANGNIIEDNSHRASRLIFDQEAIRVLNDILSDNVARTPLFGSHSLLYFPNYQVAVKTGTTNNYRDGWCIGYTPSIVVGVWAGNSDNTPINKEPGVMVSAPIWHDFLAQVLPKYPTEFFVKPASMAAPASTSTSASETSTPATSDTTTMGQ